MDEKANAEKPAESAPAAPSPQIPLQTNPPPVTLSAAPEDDQRPKKMSKSDWIMSIATIVIALGTIVSAAAIFLQWREMVNGGADTVAIKNAAQKQADAAQQFADASDGINENVNDAVTKLDAQANDSAASIKATQEAMRLDQRAWFGIKEITLTNPLALGKPVQISILGLNTGKTPALNVHPTEIRVGPSETDKSLDLVVHSTDRQVVAPNNTNSFFATVTYPDDSIKALMAETISIYVRGELKYQDVFGLTHTTEFCAYYPTNGPPSSAGHFFNCKIGNSMN
jgi:hypothetical protein